MNSQVERAAGAQIGRGDLRHQASMSPKHSTAFVLAIFLSWLGVGRVGLGILKLVTLGGIFVWVIVDSILIGRGKARDGKGRPLIVR